MIAVQKGIPMPEKRSPLQKYQWDTMEVGDSFAVSTQKLASSLVSAQNRKPRAPYARDARRFLAGPDPEGPGGRIWRVS